MGVTRVLMLLLMATLTAGMTVIVETPLIYTELETNSTNCSVIDNPQPVDFRWTRQGYPGWFIEGSELTFTQTTVDQAGSYTCHVRTQSSPFEEAAADMELIVHYSPRWDSNAVPKAAGYEGSPVDVKCVTLALPSAAFYWQRGGNNLTSSGDYTITSVGNVSTLRVNTLDSADYGNYECFATNYVGSRSFTIALQRPGIPDSPNECTFMNVTSYTATVQCTPGFDGGDPASLKYTVMKRQPFTDPTETPSTWTDVGEHVVITAEELNPANNYTLLIYQENTFGKSDDNFGVFIRTLDGPPLNRGDLSIEMIAIIGGCAGGVVLVAVIILLVVCFCCKRKKDDTSSGSNHVTAPAKQKKKDVHNYVMEEDYQRNQQDRADSGRGSMRDVRNSFRLKKPLKVSSGIHNPNYVADEAGTSASPRVMLDYTSPRAGETPSQGAYFINLDHNPGETEEGVYENPAFMQDTPLNKTTSVEDVRRRQMLADPVRRAQRQSQDQPGLAGFGALTDLHVPGLAKAPPVHQPLTPTVRKEVRLSIRPPSFEPDVPWEFSRERLFVRLKVGEGTFGEVWRAKADGILGRPGRVAVAVKMLKENYTPEERRSLIKELEIMKLLQPHPNIVHLLGCCTLSEPLCIIMEYAANGNLQDLLRLQRSAFGMNDLSTNSPASNKQRDINLQLRDLKRFGLHVASGMEYIASRELLHRDLAARNILVDENMICKVADFGSARDVIQMRQYESKTQRRLPLRWMAPESLIQCVYTVHSDVWSFGVLLWEIVTLGSSPYPGMNGPDVMDYVQKGCRMAKPRHCSNAMYAIMKDCWNHFPPKRPSFSILRHRMIAIMDEPTTDSLYVDQMCDNAYDICENLPGEKC